MQGGDKAKPNPGSGSTMIARRHAGGGVKRPLTERSGKGAKAANPSVDKAPSSDRSKRQANRARASSPAAHPVTRQKSTIELTVQDEGVSVSTPSRPSSKQRTSTPFTPTKANLQIIDGEKGDVADLPAGSNAFVPLNKSCTIIQAGTQSTPPRLTMPDTSPFRKAKSIAFGLGMTSPPKQTQVKVEFKMRVTPPARVATEPIIPNKPKRKKADHRGCACKRSKCLKLYCDCLAVQGYCDPNVCKCVDCHNTADEKHDKIRRDTIEHILSRNPNAFFRKKAKVKKKAAVTKDQRLEGWGCKCKKSQCQKGYCECYQANVACGTKCKCVSCLNTAKSPGKGGKKGGACDHTHDESDDSAATPVKPSSRKPGKRSSRNKSRLETVSKRSKKSAKRKSRGQSRRHESRSKRKSRLRAKSSSDTDSQEKQDSDTESAEERPAEPPSPSPSASPSASPLPGQAAKKDQPTMLDYDYPGAEDALLPYGQDRVPASSPTQVKKESEANLIPLASPAPSPQPFRSFPSPSPAMPFSPMASPQKSRLAAPNLRRNLLTYTPSPCKSPGRMYGLPTRSMRRLSYDDPPASPIQSGGATHLMFSPSRSPGHRMRSRAKSRLAMVSPASPRRPTLEDALYGTSREVRQAWVTSRSPGLGLRSPPIRARADGPSPLNHSEEENMDSSSSVNRTPARSTATLPSPDPTTFGVSRVGLLPSALPQASPSPSKPAFTRGEKGEESDNETEANPITSPSRFHSPLRSSALSPSRLFGMHLRTPPSPFVNRLPDMHPSPLRSSRRLDFGSIGSPSPRPSPPHGLTFLPPPSPATPQRHLSSKATAVRRSPRKHVRSSTHARRSAAGSLTAEEHQANEFVARATRELTSSPQKSRQRR